MADAGHRKMTSAAAKDLVGLLIVLALIVAGMLAFRKQFKDPDTDAEKAWYYQRIAPSHHRPRTSSGTDR